MHFIIFINLEHDHSLNILSGWNKIQPQRGPSGIAYVELKVFPKACPSCKPGGLPKLCNVGICVKKKPGSDVIRTLHLRSFPPNLNQNRTESRSLAYQRLTDRNISFDITSSTNFSACLCFSAFLGYYQYSEGELKKVSD